MSRLSRWFSEFFRGRQPEARQPPSIGATTTRSRESVEPRPVLRSNPAESDSSRQRPSRLVHLGVDFGTCWSKLVLRDYEAATSRCFVVRPGKAYDAGT